MDDRLFNPDGDPRRRAGRLLERKLREAPRQAASIIDVLWVPGVFLRLFRLGE